MFFDASALSNQIPLRVLDAKTAKASDGFVFPRSVDLALLPLTDGSGFGIARRAAEEIHFTFKGRPSSSEDTRFLLAFDRPAKALGALKNIQRLDAMLNGQSLTKQNIPLTTRKRLRAALVGVDGLAAGMSYREVAILIYGEELVQQSWNDIDRILKNRTIRAVQRGRRYVAGEYRKLLG
ncbi:MAG: DUF2285 domain-containing protein [Pseudomonadota bacterium]